MKQLRSVNDQSEAKVDKDSRAGETQNSAQAVEGLWAWGQDVVEKVKAAMPNATEAKKMLPLGIMLFFILFDYTILRDTKVGCNQQRERASVY